MTQELTRLAIGALIYGLALVRPKVLQFFVKDPKTSLTKKSAWVRTKTLRFTRRLFIYSFPIVFLAFTVVFRFLGWSVIWALPLFYTIISKLYSQHLNEQYELWQQLGYDGPPALEEQAEKVSAQGS